MPRLPRPSRRRAGDRTALAALLVALLSCAPGLRAQQPAQSASEDWPTRLIAHPLYLRGSWAEDKIEFDPDGKPLTPAYPGPLTLSGIEVTHVHLDSSLLVLTGRRMALVAPAPGEPLRRIPAISSITTLAFSLMPHKKRQYRADEPIRFLIHPDAQGSFTPALHSIFADGLAQLTPPPYWRCYAASYFTQSPAPRTANADVLACARAQSPGLREPADTPPELASSLSFHLPQAAAEFRIQGESTVYTTINRTSQPTDFQVITPVGAGIEENLMNALAQATFQSATRNGAPVPSGFEYTFQVQSQ